MLPRCDTAIWFTSFFHILFASLSNIYLDNKTSNFFILRPDRIIVGEVRSDAEELLQAVNVGAEGSMSTIHANSCRDMITRLETLVLMGINLPLPAIRRQIAAGFDVFVHLGRLRDKSRRLLEICEIDGIVEDEVVLNPLFLYEEECGLVQKGRLKHRGKLERAGITLEDGL